MSATMIPATDTSYEDSTIKSVRRDGDGWTVTKADGWSLFVSATEPPPQVGDRIRCYMVDLTAVRGVVVNDRVVRYQTEDEYRREIDEQFDAKKRERIAEAEAHEEETAVRIKALPAIMQVRLAGFIARKPDFWWESLPAELFVCEQAVAVAKGCKTADVVLGFRGMAFDAQRQLVPEWSSDHSGATGGFALRLAYRLLTAPEDVAKEHGIYCRMLGCRDYGCQYGERT